MLKILFNLGDPAASYILNRPPSRELWSSGSSALAQTWLRECLASHADCHKPALTYMPKRVLQASPISNGACEVQLRDTVDAVQYATLSYCWGGDQPHKLTKARLQTPQPIPDWDNFPKTIQDAVKVAVDLSISYIWIDSLCIVQDDEVEMALQIAEMPRIYAESALTIMASRAARVTDGFLRDDVAGHQEAAGLAVRLPFRCPGGSIGTAILCCQDKSREPEPIDHRAWTFQEYYLSNRILTFGTLQMRWHCVSSQDDTTGRYADGWKWQHNPDDSRLALLELHRGTQKFFEINEALGLADTERDSVFRDKWHTLVVTYSRRSLSFPKDRSLAISGIADIISPVMNDQYLAGHWRRSLPSDLMWHMETSDTRLCPRPSEYQGPSWSWTGVNGEVIFLFNRAVRSPALRFCDAETELTDSRATYGAVRRGQVTVQGRLRKALWYGSSRPNGRLNRLKYPMSAGAGSDDDWFLITKVFPDAIEDEFSNSESIASQPLEVHLFEYGQCTGLRRRGPCGVVLREAADDRGLPFPKFSRLGIFHIDERLVAQTPPGMESSLWERKARHELGFFDGYEPETITIE